jgi:ketosteroid isomerase-like protein
MSVEQNKKLAAELIKAVSAGDAEGIRTCMAPEASWWVMGFPRDRTMTRDQFIGASCGIVRKVLPDGLNLTVLGMTAEDDRVAVEAEGYAYTIDRKLYNNFYHFLFQVREGKVIRAMEYTNPSHGLEVFGNLVKHLPRP